MLSYAASSRRGPHRTRTNLTERFFPHGGARTDVFEIERIERERSRRIFQFCVVQLTQFALRNARCGDELAAEGVVT
jgi:hypothetical protein